MSITNEYLKGVYDGLVQRNPEQKEFLQAAEEVLESLEPVIAAHPEYEKAGLIERMVEPERVVMFRVPWVDDSGKVQVNRGYRVQFTTAIGPSKGGLRFHPRPSTCPSSSSWALSRCFKNTLTGLPMGGGKGGADFDPHGKTERGGHALLPDLHDRAGHRHIGPDTDVPAGDIGVGARESRLPVRPVQAHPQRVHRRAHRQGPALRRLPGPHRGHRLRPVLLRRRDAQGRRQDLPGRQAWSSPAPATWPSTPTRRPPSWAARSSP